MNNDRCIICGTFNCNVAHSMETPQKTSTIESLRKIGVIEGLIINPKWTFTDAEKPKES